MPLSNSQPKPLKLIKTKKETERRGLSDIQALIKLLEAKNRKDLSILLKDCTSYLEESSQYGSYLFSIISTFWIYVPPEKIEKVEQISENDKNFLLELVKKIYPPKEYSPEIREIQFRVLTKNIKEKKDENEQQNKSLKNKRTYIKRKNGSFLQKYFIQIIIGIIVAVVAGIILQLIF